MSLTYVFNVITVLGVLSLLIITGYILAKKFYKSEVEPETKALDEFESSLLKVQHEQKNLASDLRDLKRKHDGLIEILLAFIEDMEASKHRLEILQSQDVNTIRGGMSFYDQKFSALLGALDSNKQTELLASEQGFTQAEIMAIERYTGLVLNRIIAVRGSIAHTQLKIRKSGYVVLLQHMNTTLQGCENRLYELNEPGYVQLYEERT